MVIELAANTRIAALADLKHFTPFGRDVVTATLHVAEAGGRTMAQKVE